MVEVISFLTVVVLSILSGVTFRKQYKQNALTKCLMMLVSMAMSIVVGIVVAVWLPNMVLSTIVAIIVSAVLAFAMTYKLPLYMLLESCGALLMGAMMGAMLSLMTTDYAVLSCVFFTVIYVASVLVAVGFWNREDFPQFTRAIPKTIYSVTTITIVLLGGVSAATLLDDDSVPAVEQHEHEHHS